MKVGILTYHTGTNYGGTLQCLALQSAVASLGHDVEVIDYVPGPQTLPLWRGWKFRHQGLAHVYPRLLQLRHGAGLRDEFDKFRTRHLRFSPQVSSLSALRAIAQDYDAIITGSDQVWNFVCSSAYFLDLGESYGGRKIAYAPCCTQERQPADRIEQVGLWIRDYDSISVRDSFSKLAVENASGRKATIVCDPTLLMKPEWPTHGGQSNNGSLLLYRLGPPMVGDFVAFVRRLKARLGNPPVEAIVAVASNPVYSPEAEAISYRTGPLEWAIKIRNCRFLVTDSYHAVLFALRYRIPFLAYYTSPERAPRLIEIGRQFGIEDRIVDGTDAADAACDSFSEPVRALDLGALDFIRSSWDFLKESLSD